MAWKQNGNEMEKHAFLACTVGSRNTISSESPHTAMLNYTPAKLVLYTLQTSRHTWLWMCHLILVHVHARKNCVVQRHAENRPRENLPCILKQLPSFTYDHSRQPS